MAKDELSRAEVESLINELEQKMQRLRSLYEQYFMGIERIPPTTARKEVVRLIRRLEHVHVRNTATRFKIRSLIQRFSSYKQYWNRVERQIEEGTYERDIKRARRNQQRRERGRPRDEEPEEESDDGSFDLEIDLDDMGLDELQQELEEMDARGEFEKYVETERVRQPRAGARQQADGQGGERSDAERERIKQQRLQEIQSQLGISEAEERPPPGKRSSKLEEIKRRFEERTGKKVSADASDANFSDGKTRADSPAEGLPTGGASIDQVRQLNEAKEQVMRENRQQRRRIVRKQRAATTNRANREREVYDRLIEAKRRCNESTDGLSFESVAKSMKQQREQLKRKRGAKDVDFKVVIKDGRAFLKPEPK